LPPVLALAIACAYVLGTFPSADLAARLALGRSADIRSMGSGNPGAVNVTGQLGKSWGALVLVLDIAKAAAACFLGRWLAGDAAASAAGTAAVVGHCFPLWNGFRGGKGVACAGGQLAATFPIFVAVEAVVAALGSRLRSRMYGLVCAAWIVGSALWWGMDWPNLFGPEPSGALFLGALASSAVIAYRFKTATAPSPPRPVAT
jgi:glycerol-3-phosphate acyltransferase PlsY